MSTCILAAADLPDEPALVAAAREHGIGITRRCVDAVDLLAAAAADPAKPIVLTAGIPRLTADLVQRLRAGSRTVIGLVGNADDEQRLRAWGIDERILVRGDAAASMRDVALALEQAPGGVWAIAEAPVRRRGCVIAVWGPTGAPGRTTTAIAVGETLAAQGRRTCVIDADLRSPSLMAQVGVLDDVSGIVVACRHAESATLTARSLMQCTRDVVPGLAVLGGLTRADRWPDVRDAALGAVVEEAAAGFDAVIVDIGACDASDPAADLLSLRRDASAQAVLAAADCVLAVARSSMLGTLRLLSEVTALPREPDLIALTGARGSGPGASASASAEAEAEVRRMLRSAGVAAPVLGIPRRASALERAARAGSLPRESASRGERRRLETLVGMLPIGPEPAGVRGRAGRRRDRRR